MTEYITTGPSSIETLKAKGCEVITRCKDCGKFYYENNIIICEGQGAIVGTNDEPICLAWGESTSPDGYCYKAVLRD